MLIAATLTDSRYNLNNRVHIQEKYSNQMNNHIIQGFFDLKSLT